MCRRIGSTYNSKPPVQGNDVCFENQTFAACSQRGREHKDSSYPYKAVTFALTIKQLLDALKLPERVQTSCQLGRTSTISPALML